MSDFPRSKYMNERIFDRRKFLNGTYKTYFGPGQDPGVVNVYTPPTDWNPEYSLLEMPQIVWLLVDISDSSIPEKPGVLPQFFVTQTFAGDIIPASAGDDPVNPNAPMYDCTTISPQAGTFVHRGYSITTIGAGVFDSSDLLYNLFYSDWYQEAISQSGVVDGEDAKYDPNFVDAYFAIQDKSRDYYIQYFYDGNITVDVKDITAKEMGRPEADRIAAIYADVKNYLEKLRPGKIFVNILNYSYVPTGTGGFYHPLRPGYPDLGGLLQINYIPQIGDAKDTFLGLNLFAVVVGEDAGGGVYSPTTLLDTQNKLDNFSMLLFKPSVVYEQLTAYIGKNVKSDMFPGLSEVSYAPSSESYRDYFVAEWKAVDDDIASLQKTKVNVAPGGFSATMSATNLIQAIADFYKFDPIFGEEK